MSTAPQDLPLAPAAASALPAAEASFELGGKPCRIICVDNEVPSHEAARGQSRPRLVYAAHEVAHFHFGGHRYALLEEPQGALGTEADNPAGTERVLAMLTNRELQIVQLICMGALTKQVADRLHLSEFTVRSYLKTIYCKLGVRSRGAMVYAYARSFSPTAVRNGQSPRS